METGVDGARALVQETLFGEAAAGSDASLFVFAEDAGIVAANEAACRLTGWTREELLAQSADVLSADPARAAALRRLVATRGGLAGAGFLRTRSGAQMPATFVASATTIGGMQFLLVMCVPVDAASAGDGAGRAGTAAARSRELQEESRALQAQSAQALRRCAGRS